MDKRLWVALVLAAAAGVGCDGGDDPPRDPRVQPATTTPATACANERDVAGDESLRTGGTLEGDVDGDGTGDRAAVAFSDDAPQECRAWLVVETGESTASTVLGAWSPELGLPAPRLNTLAQIDGRDGIDVVVDVGAGASTQFVAVYTMSDGGLGQLVFEPSGEFSVFPYGGSVGHIEASDCAGPQQIVVSAAVPQGKRYEVIRTFYGISGRMLVPAGEPDVRRVRFERLEMFPEYGTAPFGSCPR